MAEEFGFDEVFRDGAAGDGDKSVCRDLAVLVNGLRHQFLAGSGFAIDEHVGLGLADALDEVVNLEHFWAVADNPRKRIAVLGRGFLLSASQG